MGSLATPIAESFKLTDRVMHLVTADLTDDLAKRRARGYEGASIVWLIGHMAHHRHAIMNLLGEATASPFADQFDSAGATDGADYPTIAEFRASWDEISARLLAVLETVTDEQLMSPMGGDGALHGESKVLDRIGFLTWHEPYHMGQIGALRTQFGLTPTATLVMEAARQSASAS